MVTFVITLSCTKWLGTKLGYILNYTLAGMTIIHILYIDNHDILLLALTLVYSQKSQDFSQGSNALRDLTGDGNSEKYRFP